tara:strand:+ start:325 stop:555 length:231 start_codon:yes stop_codon:yes gene_type:complete
MEVYLVAVLFFRVFLVIIKQGVLGRIHTIIGIRTKENKVHKNTLSCSNGCNNTERKIDEVGQNHKTEIGVKVVVDL